MIQCPVAAPSPRCYVPREPLDFGLVRTAGETDRFVGAHRQAPALPSQSDSRPSIATSVILRESQKLALDEERLRIRREEGKSVSVTELMREAIDEWLAKRRGGPGNFGAAADVFVEGMKREGMKRYKKKRRR